MMKKCLRIFYKVLLLWLILTPASGGLIRDAEIEGLLTDYSRPLLLAAGLNPGTVGIWVIDDKSLNAFVSNGQNIFFHTGLILKAEEPNMVIGVIAHEIGHITGGHLVRTADAAAKMATPALVTTILGFGSILAGAGDVGMALITGGQQIAQRSFLAYNRAQEASADVTALSLLEATGQSPNGIINFMDMLAGQEIVNEIHQDPYARTHPMSRTRVNAYREGARKSAYNNVHDNESLTFRHNMVRAKIYGFLDRPSVTLRRYAGDATIPALYARAIAHHKNANLPEAIRLIDILIDKLPKNPWLYELKGQVYYESGFAANGLLPYKKAVALRPYEPLLLIGLATCQLGIGADTSKNGRDANRRAERNLRTALRFAPKSPTAYFQLSKAYGQLGETPMAEWALAEYYALMQNPAAIKHANRAITALPKNSVEYIRTRDILDTTPTLGKRQN